MKLSIRVPLLIGLIVLVTSAVIIFSVDISVTRVLEVNTLNELQSNADANAELLKTKLDALLTQLWEIANRIRVRSMDWEGSVRAALAPDVLRIESLDIGLVFPDGTTHYVTDDSTANLGDRDYIIQAFTGKSVVSDVLISRVTNQPVVMLAAPVFRNDEPGAPVVGVLVARKEGGSFLSGLINNIKSMHKSSFSFITDKEGTIIAHPDHELVLQQFNPIKEAEKDPSLKPLGNVVERAIREESGIASYTNNGKEMLCAFTKLPGYSWILILAAEKNETLAHISRIRSIILSIGAICLALSIIIAAITGRSIIKPVINIAAVMEDIGKGDLTRRINLNSKDEIGDMSGNINLMLENIKKLISTIREESGTLSNIGVTLTGNTEKAASAVSGIASTIQSINAKAINQAASVTETNATMKQISHNIDSLNGNVEIQSASVSQSSSAIEQMLANIKSVTETLIKNTDNVQELMEASELGRTGLSDVASDIQGIARDSEGLLEINSVMENIASQTNLLSMNAAIEAAHAGEAGKGFAVVADEIRKLAENSGEQSKTISVVLNKIKKSIDKIIQSTEDVLNKFEAIDKKINTVSGQEENIRNAMEEQGTGSKQILEAIGQLNDVTRQVRNGSTEMLEGSREIITEGQNLEKATREITDGMMEIDKNSGEISAAVKEVNNLSVRNKDSIDKLVTAITRFKIE